MIQQAILFTNGVVMVFNENGKQIPEYQGRHPEIVQKIIQDCLDTTIFKFAKWGDFEVKVTKEQWQANKWAIE